MMQLTEKGNRQAGFTFIETMIAMAIFTIGILGLYGMQMASARENVIANKTTTASTWAVDRVEQLLALDYTDPLLSETGVENGCAGFSDMPNSDHVDSMDPLYVVYWNVAYDCTLIDIPDATVVEEEQKPKHLKIIVTRKTAVGEERLAEFTYIKQNIR